MPTPSTRGSYTATYPLPPPIGPALPVPTDSTRGSLYLPAVSTHGSCTTTYPLYPPMGPALPPTRSIHPWVVQHHLPTPSTVGSTPAPTHSLHSWILYHHIPAPSTHELYTTTYPLPPPADPPLTFIIVLAEAQSGAAPAALLAGGELLLGRARRLVLQRVLVHTHHTQRGASTLRLLAANIQ